MQVAYIHIVFRLLLLHEHSFESLHHRNSDFSHSEGQHPPASKKFSCHCQSGRQTCEKPHGRLSLGKARPDLHSPLASEASRHHRDAHLPERARERKQKGLCLPICLLTHMWPRDMLLMSSPALVMSLVPPRLCIFRSFPTLPSAPAPALM